MEKLIICPTDKEITFGNLNVGSYFEYYECKFLKINKILNNKTTNAIAISIKFAGAPFSFSNDKIVKICKTTWEELKK